MKKSIYIASILLILVVLAVVAFIVERNRNTSDGAEHKTENPGLTVYGELSQEELVEHINLLCSTFQCLCSLKLNQKV